MKVGFNSTSHVKNLPDAFKKTPDSNNKKILEIESTACNELRDGLREIDNILDLDNARGKTLDLYGERVGQPRGVANDEKYLVMIKAKIMRSLSNGSLNSVVAALCATFGCEPSEVCIKEKEDRSCVVESVALPLRGIIGSGFTAKQAMQIIESLFPVAVTLEVQNMEGTFEFGETESEYDENKGFAISEADQSIGGYLGYMSSDEKDEILPI